MSTNPAQRIAPADIRKVLTVAAPIDRAFHVFTTRMGEWWSKDFSINRGVPQDTVVLEPKPGGRWYEVGTDGSECPWGRVLEWNAPHSVVLAWQVNAEWAYDPNFETVIDVRFEETDGSTLVTFEHRNLERYGNAAEGQFGRMDGGWAMLLERFKQQVEKSE